jgi:hypothetical protein
MPKKIKSEVFDDNFYTLAADIATAIARNKIAYPEYESLNRTEAQKRQVETLLSVEKMFKETILKYRQSTEIYKKFLQKVCIKNKNILSARPYFRETATKFSEKITPAIKQGDIEVLKTFNINYQLISFAREQWLGKFPDRAEVLFKRVESARRLLIETNLPLAVNRAKLFYRKTPRSHLTLIDLIGECSLGLAAGIDKWCGPYSPVFRSVCIGRMVGNMIDKYSETMLHFYPSDKRVLYKANSIRGRRGIDEAADLAEAVNTAFKEDATEGKSIPKTKVEAGDLSELMNASSPISADSTVNDEGYGVYSYTYDPRVDIEKSYIEREITGQILSSASKLPILNRKLLRLKGIKL